MTIRDMVLEEVETSEDLMTKHMLILERRHRLPIKQLIAPREGIGGGEIADWLDIAESTLCEWRKRFGYKNVRMVKPGPKLHS